MLQLVLPLLLAAASSDPAPRTARTANAADGRVDASLAWGDFDGDGRLDALALDAAGAPRLFAHRGRGEFVDVTARAFAEPYAGVRQAAWQDYDGDGRADLVLVVPGGASRLLRSVAPGLLEPWEQSGIALGPGLLAARWLDFDGDGAADLVTTRAEGEALWRNAGERFEEVALELPTRALPVAPVVAAAPELDTAASGATLPGSPGAGFGVPCTKAVDDFANAGTCLPASSVPMLGMLYPISTEWYVDAATGRVGVGTTSPTERLDVAGDVRASGQLVAGTASGAPLVVGSSALVPSLNADLLDGLHASAFSQLGNSIGTGELEDGAVTAPKLAASSVGSTAIANESVTGADIATAAVGSSEIADGSVTSADLANGAVTAGKIGFGAVGSFELTDGGVGNVDLANGAVDSAKLLDGGVQAVDLAHLTGAASTLGLVRVTASGSSATGLFSTASSTSGLTTGLRGASDSSTGRGVVGEANSTTGVNYGVYGSSVSSSGRGVLGLATSTAGSAYGVLGRTNSSAGAGIYGYVDQTTGGGFGMLGETRGNSSGAAVQASSLFSSNVSDGLRANTDASAGYAVWGIANVAGAKGVVGQAPSGSDALRANGDLVVTGLKNFAQAHPSDPSKEIRFACLEGDESGTYFRGSGLLAGGSAVIEVPEAFRLVTAAEGLTVQVTPHGPARVWVESRGLDRIVVRGDLDVPFDYFASGLRRGFEDFQALRANQTFKPRFRGLPFGEDLPPALRQQLVANGLLNADFTPNEATAAALGWTLVDPSEQDAVQLLGAAALQAR